jgi:hypothetical protein
MVVLPLGGQARAAGWSPAQVLGAPVRNARRLGVLFGRDGSALISLSFERATLRERGQVIVRRPDGRIARVQTTHDELPAAPVGYGADHVAVVRQRAVPAPPPNALGVRVRLSVSRGTVAVPISGRPVPVAEFPALSGSRVAIAARRDGEVAVAWTQLQLRRATSVVRMAIARPGQGFGPPRRLTSGVRDAAPEVTLAYGSGDELVIAYATDRGRCRVMAATVRSPTGQFRRAQVLGPREGGDSLAAAATGDGHDVVAWGTQDTGIKTSKPWVVRAAVRRGLQLQRGTDP